MDEQTNYSFYTHDNEWLIHPHKGQVKKEKLRNNNSKKIHPGAKRVKENDFNNNTVSPNVEQGFCFMHLYITDGTIFARFQVAHNAHFADCNRENISQKKELWC